MPRNSPAMAMVLAVNWPPQAPGPGQGCGFDGFQLVVVDLARGMRADRLENIEDGDVFRRTIGLLQTAGRDAAAVEHEAWDIQPRHRHDGGGHVLVAARDADDAVEEVAARDEFDGIGDHLARDQAGLHALRSHRDAVRDGDGVELHGSAAGLADALFDGCGDVAQMEVAGPNLCPSIGHANNGLMQILFARIPLLANTTGPPLVKAPRSKRNRISSSD